MVGMDDQIARRQRRQFGEEGVGALPALRPADEAVAEHVLLGQQRDIGAAIAMVERQNDQRGGAFGGQPLRLLPCVGQREAARLMVGQQAGKAFARACRIAGDDDLAPCLPLIVDMDGDGIINVRALRPFWREVAGGVHLQIEHGRACRFVEGRGDVDRMIRDLRRPFVRRQVKLIGGERSIAAGIGPARGYPVGVIIGDRLESRLRRAGDAAVAQDQRILAQMVEQGYEPFFEQRQPMLHPRQTPPVAHRLIKRVAGRRRAEQVAIAGTEALDSVLVQQCLGRGEQGKALHVAG